MSEKHLYLSDEPINKKEDDKFHHDAYAEILFRIVKEVDTPSNIGLFGRWGTGKTSIVKLLIDKLNTKNTSGQKYAYFEFDAWKHAGDSLREQILLELNRNLGEFSDEQEIIDKLFCIIEEETTDKKEISKLEDIYSTAPLFFISFFGVFLFSALLYLAFSVDIFVLATPLILIPLFLQLIKQIESATLSIKRKQSLPIRENPSQFEDLFKKIIGEIDSEKVVIVIDNLDRCPSKTVVEMLAMIKTFMEIEKCVYILPCDDDALRKHIKTSKSEDYVEEDVQEYLRKFFQTTIKLPPFLDEDIEKFSINLNDKLEYPFDKGVIDVLKSAYTKNPRRIIHALNKLTTLTLLAEEKEKKGMIRQDVVTGNMQFLAKISIIEEEWPAFYQKILYDESILEDIDDYLKGSNSISQNKIFEYFENNKGLKEFLNANRLIAVDNVSPFLRLCQTSYDFSLSNATAVRNCVITNDIDGFIKIFNKDNSENEKTAYTKLIVQILNDTAKSNRYQIRFNCLNMITAVYGQIPEQIKGSVHSVFSTNIDTSELIKHLSDFNPSSLFKVIKNLKNRDFLLKRYINEITNKDIPNYEILKQFIENHEIVPVEAKDYLGDVLELKLNNVPDDEIALSIIDSIASSEAKSNLLSQNVLIKLVDRIRIDDQVNPDAQSYEQIGLDLYLKAKSIANTECKKMFINKQIGFVSNASNLDNNAYIQTNKNVIHVLFNLDESDVPDFMMDTLYDEIVQFSTGFRIEDRFEHYMFILKHINKLSNNAQKGFIDQHLTPLFSNGEVKIINEMLNGASLHKVPILEYGTILNTLKERVLANNLSDSNVVACIIKDVPEKELDGVKEWIIKLIKNGDGSIQKPGMEGFSRSHNFFNSTQIDEICKTFLDISQGEITKEKRDYLNPVAQSFDRCSLEIKGRFVDRVTQLLINNDQQWWAVGKKLYDTIYSHIENDLMIRIADQVIGKLHQLPMDQIQNATVLFDVIINLEDVESNDWSIFLTKLAEMISDGQQDNIRILGLQYIGRIKNLNQKSHQIQQQVLQATKSNTSQVAEQAQKTLELISGRLPDN
jgi:Cdc6-like AAA superfamily ATPase